MLMELETADSEQTGIVSSSLASALHVPAPICTYIALFSYFFTFFVHFLGFMVKCLSFLPYHSVRFLGVCDWNRNGNETSVSFKFNYSLGRYVLDGNFGLL